jgi:putative membrane protein
MKTTDDSPYRAKIQQTEIKTQRPDHAMPVKQEQDDWQPAHAQQTGLSAKWWVLLSGAACFVGFSVFEAIAFIDTHFATAPVSTSILGVLLSAFVGSLCWLTGSEYRGYRRVNTFLEKRPVKAELVGLSQPEQVIKQLDNYAAYFSAGSYAERCYRRFKSMRQADHSVDDLLNLYQQYVVVPVRKKANEVIKKEAMASGSMAFISPNHLIQTLLLLWISVRTIKRVSQVYGLRPATTGNWKLMKILAQNLAAQSLFDLATDEMTNQLSGSLAAKLVENSAEAVAASALNVRLGKALVKLLDDPSEDKKLGDYR